MQKWSGGVGGLGVGGGSSMSLNRPTGHGNILNFIKIDREICKKRSERVQKYLRSHTTVTLK